MIDNVTAHEQTLNNTAINLITYLTEHGYWGRKAVMTTSQTSGTVMDRVSKGKAAANTQHISNDDRAEKLMAKEKIKGSVKCFSCRDTVTDTPHAEC